MMQLTQVQLTQILSSAVGQGLTQHVQQTANNPPTAAAAKYCCSTTVVYVRTEDQHADLFTKPLDI